MSSQMPDSITQVLLAALNSADESYEVDGDLAGLASTKEAPVARASGKLTNMQLLDDRQNRFVATIRLSLDKSKSAS